MRRLPSHLFCFLLPWYNHQNVSTSRRSPNQVRTMAFDIIKLYISILSEFFLLSDKAVTSPASASAKPPPLFPLDSNVLTTAHYLMKVLGEIQENVNEVNLMEINTGSNNEVGAILKELVESVRWKFEDVLITAWLRGRSNFCRQALLHLTLVLVRCHSVLSSRNLDCLRLRTIHYALSL